MTAIDSKVVNLDELKLEHFVKGDKFECNGACIGPLLGARDLGYSYDVVLLERARVRSIAIARKKTCSSS